MLIWNFLKLNLTNPKCLLYSKQNYHFLMTCMFFHPIMHFVLFFPKYMYLFYLFPFFFSFFIFTFILKTLLRIDYNAIDRNTQSLLTLWFLSFLFLFILFLCFLFVCFAFIECSNMAGLHFTIMSVGCDLHASILVRGMLYSFTP